MVCHRTINDAIARFASALYDYAGGQHTIESVNFDAQLQQLKTWLSDYEKRVMSDKASHMS